MVWTVCVYPTWQALSSDCQQQEKTIVVHEADPGMKLNSLQANIDSCKLLALCALRSALRGLDYVTAHLCPDAG